VLGKFKCRTGTRYGRIQREGNFLEHETPKADVKIVLTENNTSFLGWGRET
jgi:hypothetical protein